MPNGARHELAGSRPTTTENRRNGNQSAEAEPDNPAGGGARQDGEDHQRGAQEGGQPGALPALPGAGQGEERCGGGERVGGGDLGQGERGDVRRACVLAQHVQDRGRGERYRRELQFLPAAGGAAHRGRPARGVSRRAVGALADLPCRQADRLQAVYY